MSRRIAFRTWFFLALTCLLSIGRLPTVQAGPPEHPNVLLVICDQQHAGMLSCVGNPYVKTPALDRLARSGARFEMAYCGNPVCVPSRTTMFSGNLPSRIGMEENQDLARLSGKVPERILQHSMGRVFRAAGYETAFGGKVHMPMNLDGFANLTGDDRSGLADACGAFLRKKHKKPFLLVASFTPPHDICYFAMETWWKAEGHKKLAVRPWHEPPANSPEMVGLAAAMKLPAGISPGEFFRSVCPPLPANFGIPAGEPPGVMTVARADFRTYAREHWSAEQWRLHRWTYCRMVEAADALVGRVLTALRESGRERDTLVVFLSDHGDMDSAHHLEHKSILYEEATRVPLLVRLPGVTKPGLVDKEHLVSTGLDLIPTLCDFAGIAKPRELAGRSVRPLAEGRPPQDWRQSLVVESHRSRMIRTARFKYTVYDSGQPREALIDLQKDPGEMKNLAADPLYRAGLLAHRKLLVEW